jgi:hypothetical protein
MIDGPPIHQAILTGNLPALHDELRRGTSPDTLDPETAYTPLICAAAVSNPAALRLLLQSGANPNLCAPFPARYPRPSSPDYIWNTALIAACKAGSIECVQLLIDAGADIHLHASFDSPLSAATTIEIVRLLIQLGADLNELGEEARAKLTNLPYDQQLTVSREDYLAARTRRFGKTNPEKMNLPFWLDMIRSGTHAYHARKHFNDLNAPNRANPDPIWCFNRFGKSINLLPDGRIIQIAGEHEDHYDPDFCIYNDVIVHHPDGSIDIYGYPKEIFPPTDFHSATLIENAIYIIGSIGYLNERRHNHTPVYKLDLATYRIDLIPTTADSPEDLPGWIHSHKARALSNTQIEITAGKIETLHDNKPVHTDNPHTYRLDLTTNKWRRSSHPLNHLTT